MDPLKLYFNAVKHLDTTEGTEHTLRGALENLLNAIAADENPNVTVIHEPKRDKTKLGAPDFKIKLHEAILGYLETKPIGDNLDTVLKSDQIAKYKRLSGNLILTDYLEWIWLRDGDIIKRETLCYPSDAGNRRARLDSDKAEKVAKLIAGFLSVPPAELGNTNILSRALAVRCHDLRDFLLEELERQEKEHREGRLYGLYVVFKEEVFQELTLKEFADAFAQTLGYGLFLAKLNAGETTAVTLVNAKRYIPANFALLRELVDFLDELDQDAYRGIRWLVEEILSIMNTLDLTAIHEDLAFSKRSGRLSKTKDERQLFAKDPYVYFYEDFLKIDFPRIPFVNERKTFEALAALGWELMQAHLLKTIPDTLTVDVTAGDFRVEKPRHDPQHERLHINKTQYFSPVPADVWAFHIGGYQVLDKYLKSRKGRTLSLDEIENVQNVVNVLRFTIDQMQRIGGCWKL